MKEFKILAVLLSLATASSINYAPAVHAQGEQLTTPPISGRSLTKEAILPADVLARALLAGEEIELIRLEMGKPKRALPEISVIRAAPREVFFQALTLYRKANQLSHEHAGTVIHEPRIPPVDQIRPYDVWQVVDRALERLLVVKDSLGIAAASKERIQHESTVPDDVFRTIVQINRQMNILLDKQFSPSDVFQKVALGVGYSSRLLSKFPTATRMPVTPPYERYKRPSDVHRRLLDCFNIIRETAQISGLDMLEIHARSEEAVPSDVYDIASLIVSELAYLHSQTRNIDAPIEGYYPGRKIPSDVFQQAGLLEAQLQELKAQASTNPRWLKE